MPNHVTNVLTITGDNDQRVKELMDTLFDNDGNFDFDNFLPMPNELSEVTSPVRIVSEDERNALIAEYERKELAGELHPFDSKTFPLTQDCKMSTLLVLVVTIGMIGLMRIGVLSGVLMILIGIVMMSVPL